METEVPEEDKQEKYSKLADALSNLPTQQLADKVKELTVQLMKVVGDFDRRIRFFLDHLDHLENTLKASAEMRALFKAGQISAFEKKKEEVTDSVNRLRSELNIIFGNVRIIQQEEMVVIKIEREVAADLEELQKRSTEVYKKLESDSKRFYSIAQKKISGSHVSDDVAALRKDALLVKKDFEEKGLMIKEEAHLIAIIRELTKLLSRLDPLLLSLNDLISREKEHLSALVVLKGMSPASGNIEQAEKYLEQLKEEILEVLREEKLRVHDPFLSLIDQERTGIYHLQELIRSKKSFWNSLTGRGKITLRDIGKSLHLFTNEEERHAFLSAIMGLVIDNSRRIHKEVTAKSLKPLFNASEKELKRTFERAITDKLTQLNNRQFLDEELGKLVQKKTELSILLVDIDHFKRFNDTFGHLIGDKVLIEVAAILRKGVRDEDMVCRYGGEELVVILISTPLAAAFNKVSERLRKMVKAHNLLNESNQELYWPGTRDKVSITISGGLVHMGRQYYPKEDLDEVSAKMLMENLVKTADYLLYKAKEGGRNRTEYGEYIKELPEMIKHQREKEKKQAAG